VHEGGFTIHDDGRGGIYFRRPDGRVIPRSGYRAADMLDDVAVPLGGAIPSGEARMAAIVHGYEVDDEVGWNGCSTAAAINGSPVAPDWSENPSAEGLAKRVGPESSAGQVSEARGSYRVRVSAAANLVYRADC
jgi:hypothetical protein